MAELKQTETNFHGECIMSTPPSCDQPKPTPIRHVVAERTTASSIDELVKVRIELEEVLREFRPIEFVGVSRSNIARLRELLEETKSGWLECEIELRGEMVVIHMRMSEQFTELLRYEGIKPWPT